VEKEQIIRSINDRCDNLEKIRANAEDSDKLSEVEALIEASQRLIRIVRSMGSENLNSIQKSRIDDLVSEFDRHYQMIKLHFETDHQV